MPAFLLHVSAMDEVAGRPDLPEPFARAFRQAPGAMRLGAAFPDLPYFERFPRQVWRHLFGGVSFASEWAAVFHSNGSGTVILKACEALRRGHAAGRPEAAASLAFIGGWISHHALDRCVHPLVRRHVDEDLAAGRGRDPDALHNLCEKHQSLYWHLAHAGHDVIGTPYVRDRLGSFPGAGPWRARLPRDLFELVRVACLTAHARAPARREVDRWLRWTTVYGALLSSRLGRREGIRPGGDDDRRRYYQNPGLEGWIARAMDAAAGGVRAAATLLGEPVIDAAARARFLQAVPDVDISVGSETIER